MNAVIYARYSSHAQNEQSIEGQLHDCYDYAKRNDIHIVAEYIDRAITGKTDNRDQFQKMISDAPKKQFDRILVWKLDRFARNRYDSIIYKHELKKHGVRVTSVMENVGEGDESILIESMLQAYAEYYSLDLTKKINRGLRESIAKKQYAGGSVPYGYKVVNKKLVIDPETSQTVKYLFEHYAAGESMKQIVDELIRRGVRGRLGGKITYTTFSRTLTNTAYIGEYVYRGQVVDGMCEPMIDRDIFFKVQERVKKVSRAPAAGKAKVDYVLSGKLFCGHCGEHMIGESGRSKTGDMHYYYACHGRKHKHACSKKAERKEPIQDYVIQQTVQYVLNEDRINEIASAIVLEYEKSIDASGIRECQKRISSIQRQLNNLVDTLATAPKFAHPRIYEKMEQLQSQRVSIEQDMSKLRIAMSVHLTHPQIVSWIRTFLSGDPTDDAFRHRIIDAFVNSVYVYDDRILIFYNIGNQRRTVTHSAIPTPSPGSDFNALSPLENIKSEPVVMFVNMVFGLLFHRKRG